MVYDKLVEAKRYMDISAPLKAEFGDPEDTPTDTSFSSKSKDELKKLANKEGLKYTSKATKDDLVVLLENKSDETPEEDEPEEESK